jgi:hypothetical protein
VAFAYAPYGTHHERSSKSRSQLLTICITVLAAGNAVAQTAPPKQLSHRQVGRAVLIIGELGFPIGKEMIIHGFKRNIVKQPNMFEVDEIDGKRLERSIFISVPDLEQWPDDTEATLQGCERGELRFLYDWQTSLPALAPGERRRDPVQMLFTEFEVRSVISKGRRRERSWFRGPLPAEQRAFEHSMRLHRVAEAIP